MSKICRHFKALHRKNFILWKRSLVCGAFEFILPCALMAILVWIRTMINIKQTDLKGLEKYKHPGFPALTYDRLGWEWDTQGVNDEVATFMEYTGYMPDFPFTVTGEAGDPANS